ncbi:unnamed protein product [Rotaria sordida]|uniref:Cyclin N-terminal domain-containing protein n=1 Tax=Rotaria sordida TaxID=392033 RepID=A0A815E6S0_9BILA|nr:unnamed protein product [Rotaria sordida]CAF1578258.1 unnamed protein product [Rotaria sordida]
MMKLRRRRPLSVYNASPNSNSQNSLSNQPLRKRQRKVSIQSITDHEENDSETENRSPFFTSDESDDDDDRSSGIQTRSTTYFKRNKNESSNNESEEEEEDETNESQSEEEEEGEEDTVVKHSNTRMVTRQMSLIMNIQMKPKPNVKVQPFVDHTEDTLSENGDNQPCTRLRSKRLNNDQYKINNGAQFFIRITPIDDDDTSQPAAFSSIKKEIFYHYTTPERPDDADIDYEQLVNRTRIKPASMDQCNQGQLLPDESIDNGNNTRPTELIPYLLQLEQSLMPVLPIIKQKKKSAKFGNVIYQRRFQVLLDYLYSSQRCSQISELIRLHLRSRLVLNTLFLTVNLFDRAILTGQLPRECYSDGNPHLLLTCLLIAGKFEEVEWPSISSLIANRESLEARDIKSLEIIVLQSLSFDIGLTVLDFVYRYCEISPMDKSNDDLRLLFFILQLLLIDPHTFIAHKSSYIAACSYALVRHLKQYKVTWPRRLARSTGYDPAEIAYGVTKVAAQCLRALSSNEQQELIHRDLMHKYAKGPAAQLIKYEQALNDLIQPASDENQ